MDEELINLTTEEEIGVNIEEVIESEIRAEDLEQNINIEEAVQIIDVGPIEEINIEMDESIGWVGGDSTRHYSLYGREEPDQHPITAITGLREELNDIEALDVVYSDERNQANYYLWQDENILQENRVGYFVNACDDMNEIKLCTSDNDIFGVTVDSAGFIGAQADIPRDIKYGLVVTTGMVHVRCESTVNIGDYVISNDYGYAQSNDNGYKVVGRHQIDGVEYAEITLVTPINRICKLSDDVENVNQRMDDAETNIVAAVNMANAAYNKASEATSVSEEVLKDALEALKKVEDTGEEMDKFLDETAPSITEVWKEAQVIAESAAASALTAKDEAISTANDAWAKSEDVVKEFQSLTAKIDQYSVGEYSQAYGLTLEQVRSILKAGMIYVPTKHLDARSHSEVYLYTDDDGKQQQATYSFTPGNHYEWDGNTWVEYGNTVAFFSEEPAPSRVLQYWYIDSNEAPEGYEAHALYVNQDGQWTKVNILDGNVNNRITSMIRQTADSVALEVTNARGTAATLGARISDTESEVQTTAQWAKGKTENGDELYNIATIKQTSSDDGSSLALVVADTEGNKILTGASIVLGQNEEDSYIQLDADVINFTAEDYQVIADNIDLTVYVTFESLQDEGATTINGSNITTGIIKSNNYIEDTLGMKLDLDDGVLDSAHFKVASDGKMTATGGTIGGWTLTPYSNAHLLYSKFAYSDSKSIGTGIAAPSTNFNNDDLPAFWAGYAHPGQLHPYDTKSEGANWEDITNFYVTHSGHLHAKDADIEGNIKANTGDIGGWIIDDDSHFYKGNGTVANARTGINSDQSCYAFYAGETNNQYGSSSTNAKFRVGHDGGLVATSATITGTIQAGSIIGGTNGGSISNAYKGVCLKAQNLPNYCVVSDETCLLQWWSDSNYTQGGSLHFSPTAAKDSNNKVYCGYLDCNNGYISGTWTVGGSIKGQSSGSVTSDERMKNTISSLSDDYSILFDNLNPVTYKYNDGTSGRFHTGFIAQEVKSALDVANIDTKDFAGLVIFDQGTEIEEWALRYDEFVALNTWQIQKAKARITELEEKVAELEVLIKGE